MNAPTKLPATLATGNSVAPIVPTTIEETFRLAGAFAGSGMAPRGMDKPEQVMVAILAGAELGLPPFQAVQSFAVVNGRPALWGDGLVAVVRRHGVKIREWHDGETAFCEVTRPDTGEVIVREFSQADAKAAGLAGKQGPWTQYPKRMRQMRARAWAVRDGCADMLRGLAVAEEAEDMGEARVVSERPSPAEQLALETQAPPAAIEIVDEEAVELPTVDAAFAAACPEQGDEGEPAPQSPPTDDAGSADLPELDGDTVPMFEDAAPEVPLAADLTGADEATVLGWADTFERTLRATSIKSARAQYWQVAKEAGRIARLLDVDRARATTLHAIVNGKDLEGSK